MYAGVPARKHAHAHAHAHKHTYFQMGIQLYIVLREKQSTGLEAFTTEILGSNMVFLVL